MSVRVDVCACARVRVRAPRASLASRGEADAPQSGSLGDSVGYCPPRRSAEAGSGGDDPAPAGRAVAYTRLGRSTLQSPLLPAKRASLKLGPADPPFLAPGSQGRQRSATSLTPCESTPPPGHVGCGLPRDLHPSLPSPGFHQACTFSFRVSRYLRP